MPNIAQPSLLTPESVIAGLIAAATVDRPVSEAKICEVLGWERTNSSRRRISAIINRLRYDLPIGSKRGKTHGYFVYTNADDLRAVLEPFERQIFSELKTRHRMKTHLRRLEGERRIQEWTTGARAGDSQHFDKTFLTPNVPD